MPILILLLVGVFAYIWISRSRELFCLRLRKGKLKVQRGTLRPGLMRGFRDALGGAQTGSIRCHRGSHGAQLTVRGDISEAAAQRMRNALGLYPMSQLSARPINKRQVAGDMLTLHWILRALGRR
jgi:hypothetical protein